MPYESTAAAEGTVIEPPMPLESSVLAPVPVGRRRVLRLLIAGTIPVLLGALAMSLLPTGSLSTIELPASLGPSLKAAAGFFVLISLELAVLFLGVSILLGLLQEYIPLSVLKRLVPDGIKGCFIASGLGGLTPFCSCSTIPVLVGLLNAGVGFGPSAAFLIASPLVDPMVLILFWLAFGWQSMLIYTILTLLLAALIGMAWDRLGLGSQVKPVRIVGLPDTPTNHVSFRARLTASLVNAAGVFRAFLPYLLVGALIGSLIYGFVPEDWVIMAAGSDNPVAVPTAALIGIPIYIRAETMMPIGLALYGKGMSMGAIVALMITGAGISIPEIILLAKIFKPRLIVIFTATMFVMAVALGYLFNGLFT